MEQDDSNQAPALPASEIITRQLPGLRERRGMSQRQLSRVLSESGFPIAHPTIARTETPGARSVTLDETIALAAALDVCPIHLFLPVRADVDVAITPARVVSPRQARQWVRGQASLPGQDRRAFAAEVMDDEWRAAREVNLRAILGHVQRLVSATIRDDRGAMADEVDAINHELENLRGADDRRAGP